MRRLLVNGRYWGVRYWLAVFVFIRSMFLQEKRCVPGVCTIRPAGPAGLLAVPVPPAAGRISVAGHGTAQHGTDGLRTPCHRCGYLYGLAGPSGGVGRCMHHFHFLIDIATDRCAALWPAGWPASSSTVLSSFAESSSSSSSSSPLNLLKLGQD